jgi:hypothetical protein
VSDRTFVRFIAACAQRLSPDLLSMHWRVRIGRSRPARWSTRDDPLGTVRAARGQVPAGGCRARPDLHL